MESFDEEFMNLVATMLLPKPGLRLALAEVKTHPWYQMEVADLKEVQEVMRARQKMIEEDLQMEDTVPDSSTATDVISQFSHH